MTWAPNSVNLAQRRDLTGVSYPGHTVPSMSDPRDLEAEFLRRSRVGSAWWRRRRHVERVLILTGLVVLAAAASSTIRHALAALMMAGVVLAVLGLILAWLVGGMFARVVRRRPLADFAAGYLLGRRHERRISGRRTATDHPPTIGPTHRPSRPQRGFGSLD